MEHVSQLTEFGKVFIMLLAGVLLVGFTLFLSGLLAPKKPNPLKLSSYECGEEPTGNSRVPFNTRFYVVALVFLLFDVEMIFIFPWSTVFAQKTLIKGSPEWGWLSLTEMFVFVAILLLGLVYIWKRGDLEWIKPQQKLPSVTTAIPKSAYERINTEVYKVRDFTPELQAENKETEKTAAENQKISGVTKPGVKPAFKRIQK